MKQTLLQLTQAILASMASDEVNSITDTAESQMVANFIKETYYEMVPRANLPLHYDLFELEATTAATPSVMTIPDDVHTLLTVSFDNIEAGETGQEFVKVQYLMWPDFLNMMRGMNPDEADVDQFNMVLNGETFQFFCYNERFPRYYTTHNDYHVIFDAYNSEVGSSLTKSKTECYGMKFPTTWENADDFIPDLPPNLFPLLLSEAKSQCFIEIKQTPNPKAEQRARRGWVSLQNMKRTINEDKRVPANSYGRKRQANLWYLK